ncbi:MAG: adenylate kinase [Elusimicrobiota bacterium]
MNLILFGAPGSGKGTQALSIAKEKGISFISTGDILREAVISKSSLGQKIAETISRGSLVSDSIILGIIDERLRETNSKNGFLLDGFPRTLPQAKLFEGLLLSIKEKIDKVILLDVTEENIVQRILSRRTCKKCGAKFNLETLPPKVDGVCDDCGGSLFQRSDDTEKIVKHRLSVYYIETQPLADYYKNEGLLVTVDGNRPVEEISKEIAAILHDY